MMVCLHAEQIFFFFFFCNLIVENGVYLYMTVFVCTCRRVRALVCLLVCLLVCFIVCLNLVFLNRFN